MKHLRNILKGMTIASEVLGEPRPYRDLSNGFTKDRKSLQNDVNTITQTLNKQIQKEYGKQKYVSQS